MSWLGVARRNFASAGVAAKRPARENADFRRFRRVEKPLAATLRLHFQGSHDHVTMIDQLDATANHHATIAEFHRALNS
jgi:hypothetical protein